MTGLTLFGLGAAILVLQSSASSDWPEFMPAIAVMGLGMGGIWAPMATETMRGVPMALAGAASGVNNTLRKSGRSSAARRSVRCSRTSWPPR
jgi:hypothetical protein